MLYAFQIDLSKAELLVEYVSDHDAFNFLQLPLGLCFDNGDNIQSFLPRSFD